MKSILRIAALTAIYTLLGFYSIGCGTPSNPPTPAQLAPGYQNSADQTMGEILSGAHAFYTSVQQQVLSGALTLTPDTKAKFNDFGTSLNIAQSVYLAYHAGTQTQAAAQQAVDAVAAKQAALPLPGAVKGQTLL